MLGFGTKTNTTRNIIQYAIDNGYYFIDTKDSNNSVKHIK